MGLSFHFCTFSNMSKEKREDKNVKMRQAIWLEEKLKYLLVGFVKIS